MTLCHFYDVHVIIISVLNQFNSLIKTNINVISYISFVAVLNSNCVINIFNITDPSKCINDHTLRSYTVYFSFTKIRMFLYAHIYWLAEFGDVSCLQFNYLRVETLTHLLHFICCSSKF
jgi:hypothetical protein